MHDAIIVQGPRGFPLLHPVSLRCQAVGVLPGTKLLCHSITRSKSGASSDVPRRLAEFSLFEPWCNLSRLRGQMLNSLSAALSTTLHGLYYVCLPLLWLLKILLTVLIFVSAPLLHVGHYLLLALLWPIHLLGRLEVSPAPYLDGSVLTSDLDILHLLWCCGSRRHLDWCASTSRDQLYRRDPWNR